MLAKIKNWVKNNKGFTIILSLAVILIIILLIIFISLIRGNSSNKYGNRLDGIEEVKIGKKVYDSAIENVMAINEINNFDNRSFFMYDSPV